MEFLAWFWNGGEGNKGKNGGAAAAWDDDLAS